jgi:uncharacterized protein YggU (UPF0235/DUF167 family)
VLFRAGGGHSKYREIVFVIADNPPWQVVAGGLRLRVRLTPKSSSDTVLGVEQTAVGSALKVKVRAVPEKGSANAALERLVADWLGLARRDVTLDTGSKSRVKTILVAGDGSVLSQRAAMLLLAIET